MGENSNHWVSQACRNLNNKNIGWCLWTQKRLGGSGTLFSQTSSPMKIKYANIYTQSGRTALLTNVLNENCVRQKDYEYGMTKMINNESSLPYNGTPAAIPGKIFASDYDLGKNGTAYADSIYEMDVYNGPYWNNGVMYRNDGVDIEASADATGNGVDVGWIENNDWMNYTVNVNQTGNYGVQLRVANGETHNGSFTLKADGKILDTVTIPVTGGNQTWTTVALGSPVRLSAGSHTIQLLATVAGGNLSWIDFTLANTSSRLQLQVVPNPVRDKLRIYNIHSIATVKVLDVSGRQLMTFTVPDENYALDVSTLINGTYMLEITEGKKIVSRVFIKQ